MGVKTLLTLEQFVELPSEQERHFELDDGELIELPGPTPVHNLVRDTATTALGVHLLQHPVGMVLAGTDVRLGTATVRRPDIAFYSREVWDRIDPHKVPVLFAPDLVAEVISPNDTTADLNHRVNQYFRAGIQEIWLIYYKDREVHIRRPSFARILGGADTLESPEILPGFSLSLGDLFEWVPPAPADEPPAS